MKMLIDGWGTNLRFSAAHFIPDLGKCSRLHGHDYAVSIEIIGEPENGVLIDYGVVKKFIRNLLEYYDHRILVPKINSVSEQNTQGDEVLIKWSGKTLSVPLGDVAFIDSDVSSSENLSRVMSKEVATLLMPYKNLAELTLTVYEGPAQASSSTVKIHD